MKDSSSKTDDVNQLGVKEEKSIEKSLGDCSLSWTPGQEQTMTGKVYQQGGITSSKGKQESMIHYPPGHILTS